jgi:hypothetical protein
MSVAPLLRIPVGVVVERRKGTTKWADLAWQAAAVLPDAPDVKPGTVLAMEGDAARIYAGGAEIELYRTEAGHYRDNLASGAPALWVSMVVTEDDPPCEILAVTADPAEGEGYTESGQTLVDQVPMPENLRDILARFVAEHFVEQPFVKRKRDRANPEALARHGIVDKDKP